MQFEAQQQNDEAVERLKQAAGAAAAAATEQQRIKETAAAATRLRREAAAAEAEQQRLKEAAAEQLWQAAAAQQLRQEAAAQQQQLQQQQQQAALEQQQEQRKAPVEHIRQSAVAEQLKQQAAALQQIRQQAAVMGQAQLQQQQRMQSASSPSKQRPLSPGQLQSLPPMPAAAPADKSTVAHNAKGPGRTSSLTRLAEQLEAYAAAASMAIASRHGVEDEEMEKLQSTSSLTRAGAGILATGGNRPRQRLFSAASYPHSSGSRPPSGPGASVSSSQRLPRSSNNSGTGVKAGAAGIYAVPLKRPL
jgi:hypothetical protein